MPLVTNTGCPTPTDILLSAGSDSHFAILVPPKPQVNPGFGIRTRGLIVVGRWETGNGLLGNLGRVQSAIRPAEVIGFGQRTNTEATFNERLSKKVLKQQAMLSEESSSKGRCSLPRSEGL